MGSKKKAAKRQPRAFKKALIGREPKLKLEVGKRYYRLDGDVTDPLQPTTYGCFYEPKHGWSYNDNGTIPGVPPGSKHDLVSLYKEEQHISKETDSEYLFSCVLKELEAAQERFPPFNTAHEGYAVLLEEVDELWDEIKKKQGGPWRPELIRKEGIQVVAMALRLILDTATKGGPSYGK